MYTCKIILYNDDSSWVINNEYSSSYFTLEIGIRQGDPFSTYLFIYSFRNVINCYQDTCIIIGLLNEFMG